MKISAADARVLLKKQAKPNKYRAQKTEVDGIVFHSKREAKRWTELRLMEKEGSIRDLKRQVKFPLTVNGQPILLRSGRYKGGRKVSYIADFTYMDAATDSLRIEDSKGLMTPVSALKIALMECLGHPVVLV